jgi:hypothetical protein
MKRVTITYQMDPDGVNIIHISDTTGLPAGINQTPTNYRKDEFLGRFTDEGWRVVSDEDGQVVFEK